MEKEVEVERDVLARVVHTHVHVKLLRDHPCMTSRVNRYGKDKEVIIASGQKGESLPFPDFWALFPHATIRFTQ